MAIKSIADGNDRITVLEIPVADLRAITVAEVTAGLQAAGKLAKSDTRFSATASDTVSDPAFDDDTNSTVFGASNAEGSIAPFWEFKEPVGSGRIGAYDETANEIYEAARVKGTVLTYVIERGIDKSVPPAAGGRYDVYVGMSDTPQSPSNAGGHVKRVIPLAIQAFALDCAFVA